MERETIIEELIFRLSVEYDIDSEIVEKCISESDDASELYGMLEDISKGNYIEELLNPTL